MEAWLEWQKRWNTNHEASQSLLLRRGPDPAALGVEGALEAGMFFLKDRPRLYLQVRGQSRRRCGHRGRNVEFEEELSWGRETSHY